MLPITWVMEVALMVVLKTSLFPIPVGLEMT